MTLIVNLHQPACRSAVQCNLSVRDLAANHVRQKSKDRLNPLAIASIVFGCTLCSGLVGMVLHDRLPDSHWDDNTRDVVKTVMGLIATVSALVLGLLIASGSAAYERQNSELKSLSANVMLIDRTLAMYGPDAKPSRDALRDTVGRAHDRIWSPGGVRPENMNATATRSAGDASFALVLNLAPKTDAERELKSLALQQAELIISERLMMVQQLGGSIPWPMLAVLIFWLSMLFLGVGLLSRLNATAAMAVFIGALTVAGAIFLILELSDPYRGVIRISDQPLRIAMAQIDR